MSDEPTLPGKPTPSLDGTERGVARPLGELETVAASPRSEPARPPRDLAALLSGEAGPTRLSHYVLLHKLGQGGMGVVIAAYDETLDRKVALKLLRGQAGELAHQRLVREAQAMARLSHPNVIQIYEIVELEGLAFIVMELVDGVTLREWLEAGGRSRAEILEVFTAAGRGLAAAHAHDLVHRDFKPDNVMIRTDGRVIVMDFGLARGEASVDSESGLNEPTLEGSSSPQSGLARELTAVGSLLGTPAYMAPEQFLGSTADARSDQFGFCVALWEALYGKRPFRGDNLGQLALAVTSGRPAASERGQVPTWLRKVLERGLATEPLERWPSMDALLIALVRDPTRRRRRLLAVGGVVGLALAGLAVARTQHERARAERVASCEAEGHAIEDDWNTDVQAEVQRAFEATTSGMAAAVWPSTQRRMDAHVQDWIEQRTTTCLDARVEQRRSEADYAGIAGCLDDQRVTVASLVGVWREPNEQLVARSASAVTELVSPVHCLDERHLARRAHMIDGEARDEQLALWVQRERVGALVLAGAYERAEHEAVELLGQAERLGARALVGEIRLTIGEAQHSQGKLQDARATLEQAALDAVASGSDVSALVIVTTLVHVVGYSLEEYEQGLALAEVAAALVERTATGGSDLEARLLHNLGNVHYARGAYAEALDAFERGRVISEQQREEHDIKRSVAYVGIGNVMLAQGKPAEAVTAFRHALEHWEGLLGPDHPMLSTVLNNLANALAAQGDLEAAETNLRRALAIVEAVHGPDHRVVGTALNNLGSLYIRRDDFERAIPTLRRALEIFEHSYGAEHPAVAVALANLAEVQLEVGEHAEALALYERSLAIREAAFGPEHPKLGFALIGIGRAQLGLGALSEARSALERALVLREQAEPGERAQTQRVLAKVLWAQGDHEGARTLAITARDALRAVAEGEAQLAEVEAWLVEHPADD